MFIGNMLPVTPNRRGLFDINAVNKAAQSEMKTIKVNPPQPKENVWAHYKLIGTLWLKP